MSKTKESITWHHMLALAVTVSRSMGRPIRILDVGCGQGLFLAFLVRELRRRRIAADVYGYDVLDMSVQRTGYEEVIVTSLSGEWPDIDWSRRLKFVTSTDGIPFENESFDLALSNQVLEHVSDHRRLFSELRRVLVHDGLSINLFPLKECYFEGHLRIPFAHWIQDRNLLVGYIRLLSKLGFGAYHDGRQESIARYAERHADYISFQTNYLSKRELFGVAKLERLSPSLTFTEMFYWNKLRIICGAKPIYDYSPLPWMLSFISLWFFARISSVTVVLDPLDRYRKEDTHV